jgi:hypothetical protein
VDQRTAHEFPTNSADGASGLVLPMPGDRGRSARRHFPFRVVGAAREGLGRADEALLLSLSPDSGGARTANGSFLVPCKGALWRDPVAGRSARVPLLVQLGTAVDAARRCRSCLDAIARVRVVPRCR